jgi:lysozyme family protein
MKDNFAACLRLTLAYEGGWSDNKADPGGATMKGITLATYSAWLGRDATKDELKAIPQGHVETIYRNQYWDKVRGDDLPAGLDLVAFDAAVNSGVKRGATWLQLAVGAIPDGMVGGATVGAAKAAAHDKAVGVACDCRLAFLKSLKTWPTFGKGWAARVAKVRAAAFAMGMG